MYAIQSGYRYSVEAYARDLYENYRARVLRTNTNTYLPRWEEASPFIRGEFRREAQQLLS